MSLLPIQRLDLNVWRKYLAAPPGSRTTSLPKYTLYSVHRYLRHTLEPLFTTGMFFSVQVFTLASYRRQTYIVIFNITFGLLKTNFERVAIFNKIDSVVELPKLLTSFKCHEKRQRGLKIIKEKKIKTG